MSNESWLCAICNRSEPQQFCVCSDPVTMLCEACIASHHAKAPGLLHTCLPMVAYGQHMAPGYIERFSLRTMRFTQNKKAVMTNLSDLEACIHNFNAEIDSLHDALNTYREETLKLLQAAKGELEQSIHSSIRSAESSIHQDSISTADSLLDKLRESAESPESFKMFSYEIDTSLVLSTLRSICTFRVKDSLATSNAVLEPQQFGIIGNNFLKYDLVKKKLTKVKLSQTLPAKCRLVQVDQNSVLCVSGSPATADCFLIDCSTARIRQISAMRYERDGPGLLRYANCVYVFGGEQLTSCERWESRTESWFPLPNMTHSKNWFDPCLLETSVYLCDCRRLVEVFDLRSETFQLLTIRLNDLHGSCITSFINGEFISFSDGGHSSKWRIAGSTADSKSYSMKGDHPSAIGPSLTLGTEVYFVSVVTGHLNVVKTAKKKMKMKVAIKSG